MKKYEEIITLEKASASVRCINTKGGTLFCAYDVIASCGIKHPTQWMQSHIKNGRIPRSGLTKLHVPVDTRSGKRWLWMLFASGGFCKKMVELTSCPNDAKVWLTEEVFPYQAEKKAAPAKESSSKVTPAEEAFAEIEVSRSDTADDLIINRIDSILLELLELKAQITRRNNNGPKPKN